MFESVIKPSFSIIQISIIGKNEIMVWGLRSETYILNCLKEIRKCLLWESKKPPKVKDIKNTFPVIAHGETLNKQELRKAAHIRPKGLVVKCDKTMPTNSCQWNCSIQKVRFEYNSAKGFLHI